MPSSKSSIDNRDVYYRLCKSSGYRARSAFKLLHLDEDFELFRGVQTAVDLCAAPGSWSQVLAEKLEAGLSDGTSKVVSIDLQPMAPLKNVTILQADITVPATIPKVLGALGGRKADLVVCDGAPDVTGMHDLDAYLHAQLLLAALTLSLTLLAPRGTLIFKIFLSPMNPHASMLRSQMRPFFIAPPDGSVNTNGKAEISGIESGFDLQGRRGGVWIRKPRSSRPGSGEAFLVCRNFDSSKVPLPPTFSIQALEDLAKQTTGTITLDSLSHLAGDNHVEVHPDWKMIKGWVGSGDLNAMAGSSTALETTTPAITPTIPEPKRSSNLMVNTTSASRAPLSPIITGPTPASAKAQSSEEALIDTPTTSSTSVFLSPRKYDHDTTLSLPESAATSGARKPKPPHPTFRSSIESTSPPSSSSPTFPTHERPWDKRFPSPLPSPIGLEPIGGFTDGFLGPLQPSRLTTAYADPTAPGPVSSREDANGGAISPALSTSSRTDMFFASSTPMDLPRPPKPLDGLKHLGRGLPGGSGERDRAATMPNTPTGMRTPGNNDMESGIEIPTTEQRKPPSRNDIFGPSGSGGSGSGSIGLGRASSVKDRSSTLHSIHSSSRFVSSPSLTAPSTPQKQSIFDEPFNPIPDSPLATLPTLPTLGSTISRNEAKEKEGEVEEGGPSRPRIWSRRESHLEREVRVVPREISLRAGMVLEAEPNRADPTTSIMLRQLSAVQEGDDSDIDIDIDVDGDDSMNTKPLASIPTKINGGQLNRETGKWKLEKKLGEGAFSAVWEAASQTPPKGRIAAIKLTSIHPSPSSGNLETLSRTHISFLRETSVLRRVSHPGVVGFMESFSTPYHHCLVLEQVAGGELFEYVADEKLWNEGVIQVKSSSKEAGGDGNGIVQGGGEGFVKRIFGELCEAVGWLHDVGVVHRDIKLENILLTIDPFNRQSGQLLPLPLSPAPLIKLSDFGLARFINPVLPLLETRCGSESFAAPEIIMGKAYDGRDTDSWACGVVLYTLLTGNLPFDEPLASDPSVPGAGSGTVGTVGVDTIGRARVGSVGSVGSMSEERERRRRMMRIAKGQYSFPESSLSQSGAGMVTDDIKNVVAKLLVRDPKKRMRAKDVLALDWFEDYKPHEDAAIGDGEAESLSSTMLASRGGRMKRVGRGWVMEGDLEEGLYGDVD